VKYLKRKGDPYYCYHVWSEALAARDDMFPFTPAAEPVVEQTAAEPVVEQTAAEPVVEQTAAEPVVEQTAAASFQLIGPFVAKSHGFGRFKVMNANDEPVTGNITKDEADVLALNMNGSGAV
jgi:hypothetical protein